MLEKETLIGIADKKVWFIYRLGEVDGVQVVAEVETYRPVLRDEFEEKRDKDRMIDEDNYDSFHFFWKDAVENDRTEDSYREFAEDMWDQQEDLDDPLWFYDRELSGAGMQLVDDLDSHKKVKADLEEITGDEIGSWEDGGSGGAPMVGDRWDCEEIQPIKWDVIYSPEAVEACWRCADAYRRGAKVKIQYDD